jgi:hypothetical protein
MAVKSTKLGPGTLSIGEEATPLDISCQLQNGVVSWDNDTGDDITVLCGDVVPGSRTYTSTFSGTFLQDLADQEGLVAYSWENKGNQVPFTYTPNTAAKATVTGTLIVDPLDVGSTDDYGSPMTSDFEWDIVGDPQLAWAGSAVANGEAEGTAATDTCTDTGGADTGSTADSVATEATPVGAGT